MSKLDRRAALGVLLGGAAVTAGIAMLPTSAEAVTLPKLDTDSLVEDAQYVVIGRPRRRRWRRRRCWRNRWGRLVCSY